MAVYAWHSRAWHSHSSPYQMEQDLKSEGPFFDRNNHGIMKRHLQQIRSIVESKYPDGATFKCVSTRENWEANMLAAEVAS